MSKNIINMDICKYCELCKQKVRTCSCGDIINELRDRFCKKCKVTKINKRKIRKCKCGVPLDFYKRKCIMCIKKRRIEYQRKWYKKNKGTKYEFKNI